MEYVSTFKNKLIYIFRINDLAHEGCLKIGETTAPDNFFNPNSKELNDAARKRIDSYTKTAGIKYELLHTELTFYFSEGKIKSFNDKQLHDILLRSGIKKKEFDIDGKPNEWFVCDLETAKNAIVAAKNGQDCLFTGQKSQKKSPIIFRPEQLNAIEKTKRVFKRGNEMLWNAKMRMGKTLSSLQVVKEMKFHRTIIVTHRPVVDKGWFEDFGKIFYESDSQWSYGSRDNGAKSVKSLELSGKHFIWFASMQDLRGSQFVGGNFQKNEDVFATNWDLLIIDEAHEGIETELGDKVITALKSDNTKILNLTGTAFNLLDKFDSENVFTWDYTMEQQAKANWYKEHPGDPNPYEDLPQMHIFTFNLGDIKERFEDEDKAFNFREFFRVYSGNATLDGTVIAEEKIGTFVYERDILRFLDLISRPGDTLYPFSNARLRDYFHHTLWMVPGVKEGKALTELLRIHKFFGQYDIVNVAGNEDDEAEYNNALLEVQNKIGDAPDKTLTITISCGKLTTGVTVKPWTAVFYLTGSKNTSPQSYMQTIFRVQSPAVIGGRMKTDCYVFDFAPDRALKMVAETAKVSAKAGDTDEHDREILGNFINFCPIISCDGTEMLPYDVDQMMRQLKRVYVDKVVSSGFEDGHLYSNKLFKLSADELETFANLRQIIGSTKANKVGNTIVINSQGFDNEDIAKIQSEVRKKEKRELTQEEARELLERKRRKQQRDAAVSILRGISIRMPLLLYGAKIANEDENITIDKFVEMVDDKSWSEFMPAGVTKERFAIYKKYYDEDIFGAAGKQIREMARAADKLPVLQRIQRITEIFASFRNPDKETVLTPWRVVNMHLGDTVGGYSFFSENHSKEPLNEPHLTDRGLVTQRLFENSYVKVLEINSKSGLYPLYMAYSIFRHRIRVLEETQKAALKSEILFEGISVETEHNVWQQVLAENIFVICKTEMARSITRRTLAGFTNAKVNTHVYDDLINQITNKKSEFTAKLLFGGIFKQINNMNIDAIVGNPPYQVMDGGAQASATPVYNRFVEIAKSLKPKYISMIMPSRWMTGGKGLDDFRKQMINDRSFSALHDFASSKELFPNVDIKGGVCYFLWDANYNGKCNCYRYDECANFHSFRYLCEEGDDIHVRNFQLISIKNKVAKFNEDTIDLITSPLKPYGLRGDVIKSTSKYKLPPMSDVPIVGGFKILGLDEKFKRVYKYLPSDYPFNRVDALYKYKIFITRNYGCGEIGEVPSTPVLGTPVLGTPGELCTETFIQIGAFDTREEAENLLLYIRTKFFRTMVGIRKQDQNASRDVYRYVPMQNFTAGGDIDWNCPVREIDSQLYAKYSLGEEEIAFIERVVKPM